MTTTISEMLQVLESLARARVGDLPCWCGETWRHVHEYEGHRPACQRARELVALLKDENQNAKDA